MSFRHGSLMVLPFPFRLLTVRRKRFDRPTVSYPVVWSTAAPHHPHHLHHHRFHHRLGCYCGRCCADYDYSSYLTLPPLKQTPYRFHCYRPSIPRRFLRQQSGLSTDQRTWVRRSPFRRWRRHWSRKHRSVPMLMAMRTSPHWMVRLVSLLLPLLLPPPSASFSRSTSRNSFPTTTKSFQNWVGPWDLVANIWS